ncbi:sodium/proline symporter [Dasania sp. GY-MA-18]|uniref:Sodium/proline symporter n=1 Tax=Dasania phycosphaerae TaxID=2950436 RepID=A0A9J6RHA6_9GAMM|nr:MULTISPECIES: sodium/proline symporter [Dasania]MCR8921285.1 sodium/proline symporter [Dasania sp. GY-MA-18]MCZ0863713.1 sodium/proline symporter [Dasania phycosphaerae]MCZ0867441.1 sodium/proline symporter [Dasania phycosphaerae]
MLISFIVCLLAFVFIGAASAWKSRSTKQDYYLASASVKPWLVGLSAVATNNSGYMFIGVIGYTYSQGLSAIWLMLGWICGDFLASLYVHKRMRAAAERSGEVSYAGVLSHWHGQNFVSLQRLIGIVSLLFLLTYAAAQLMAGGKALHVLLGWPLWSGAAMGALFVCIYCYSGGIRASIWTDAAQSIVMIVAMAVLLVAAVSHLGGMQPAIEQLHGVPGYMDWMPKDLLLPGAAGAVLFVVGWLFAGFSVIGQPHVMVRFMTLNSTGNMQQAKIWYYLWFTAFYCMATGVGLLAKIYLSDTAGFDAELALPTMAQELLPAALVGLILAGIFAATMSTADSLVLSCSAALTHDILPGNIEKVGLLKLSSVLVTALALVLAIFNKQSVFGMVVMAWSGLASAFAPLLLMHCLGYKFSERQAIAAVFTGFSVALLWRLLDWHNYVYEGFPGIVIGVLFLWVAKAINDLATGKLAATSSGASR